MSSGSFWVNRLPGLEQKLLVQGLKLIISCTGPDTPTVVCDVSTLFRRKNHRFLLLLW